MTPTGVRETSSVDRRAGADEAIPLIVDVDGTLIRTDLLKEAMLQMVARFPLEAWQLAPWLLAGKAAFKSRIADRVEPGIATIPLREETMALIRRAQEEGRPVYLASASDHRYVARLAERIGGIAGIFATDPGTNLAGKAKAARLVQAFGEGGFDYVGDQPVDFPVWRAARKALAVAHSDSFERRVLRAFPDAEVIGRPRPRLRAYIKMLRPQQWAKNLLIFLPLIAGHAFNWEQILAAVLAFACFCSAASSAYVVNDLLDLPADRGHARKRNRPLAAGAVPIDHGLLIAMLLMAASILMALQLPWEFAATLIVYVASTLCYSFILKRKVLIDVIVLSGLYTLRVFGGVVAIGNEQSQWLLMFSLFLFLDLALLKRCSELIARKLEGGVRTAGRGYRIEDLSILFPLGAAAGMASVLVVALYLSSPKVAALYGHPSRLWLICPLLIYWNSRLLLLSHRGDMHDDPLIFTFTDRVSWIAGACIAAVIAISI